MIRQMRLTKTCLAMMVGLFAFFCGMTDLVWALQAGEAEGIYDYAKLLTEEEALELAGELSELAAKSGWEIFVLTTEDAKGSSAREYSEAFLDGHLIGDDGIVYTIDMDNREVYLATTGDAIYYLTDNRIEDIIDEGYDYVVDGAYKAAFSGMMTATGAAYDKGIPSDQYTYDEDTGKIVRYQEPKSVKWYEALVALALACGAFLAVFLGVLGKYRLKWDAYKYDFHANGRVDVTNQEDRLVNQLVTHRHIQRNTSSGSSHSSGSRSSVHTGSGGRSYGGGGRKF